MLLIVHMREPAKSPLAGIEICWFETDFKDPSRIDVQMSPDGPTITFSAEKSGAVAWGVSQNGVEDGSLASWREQYLDGGEG